MSIYRGEQWAVSYGIEATYGAAPTGALTATNLFGVFDDATLPDLEFEHTPYWMQGTNSDRNYYTAYKGRARSTGTIPDIILLDGRPLFLPITDVIDHNDIQGAVASDGGSMTDELADARNATINDIALLPAIPVQNDAFYFGSYNIFSQLTINIGTAGVGTWTITWEYYNGAWTALASVVDSTGGFMVVGSNSVGWTLPTDWAVTNVNGKSMYWVRARVSAFSAVTTQPLGTEVTSLTISGSANGHVIPAAVGTSRELKSIRVVATNVDSAGTTGLCRWFVGGKANRATYHCEEGGMLMMSLDDIVFKMPYYEDDDATNISPWYDADSDAQTLTFPTTEPYYFSQATFKMKLAHNSFTELTIPSIRNFRLEVNNNLEPKYYIASNAEKVPYEIIEGRREYRLSFVVDLVDYATGSFDKNHLFLELLNQGMDTTLKGCAWKLRFARSTYDYIEFITPIDYYPAAGGDEQGAMVLRAPHNIVTEGAIGVPVEMNCRNLGIVVMDAITGANYPV